MRKELLDIYEILAIFGVSIIFIAIILLIILLNI